MTKKNKDEVLVVFDATGEELHVDVPLSNLITNYVPDGFIAGRIMPTIDVPKQSDIIPEIPLGEFMRLEEQERSPGTEARKVKFGVSTKTFYCLNYALKSPLTVEDISNADAVWNLRQNRGIFVKTLIMIGYERRVQQKLSGNVSSTYLPASAWNAGGDPFTDIETALNAQQDSTGRRPNVLVLGKDAWRTMRTNSYYRNLLFPHGGGLPTEGQVAALHNVDEVLVPREYYNTTAEQPTPGNATLSPLWTADDCFGVYRPPISGNAIPPSGIWGATFSWRLGGGVAPNFVVRALPFEQKILAEEVEVGAYLDEKVLDSTLAVKISGVNSAQ